KGFAIARDGKREGKIVELDNHGNYLDRPFDFSITKAVAGIIMGSFLIVFFFLHIASKAQKNMGKAPRGAQNIVEPVIIFVRDEIVTPSIGEKKTARFLPYLLTLFFFILFNNLFGLIPLFPFGANVTGNISVTLVLALFTFGITNINGNRYYWKEIFNPDVPVLMKLPVPIMPFVEVLGAIIKPFVLMVRLFANMLAGHLIITVFISLIFIFASAIGAAAGLVMSPISVVFSIFIFVLDILVSFIQAYVFTLLSALYIGIATSGHH
ncbi:MAG: F0F1 ATP synthase subunit A, partial [Prolixibacteraceae bacterium]|nr:F0F1 ATP synthase subunit A [Prolixibacteraceae bacterium]